MGTNAIPNLRRPRRPSAVRMPSSDNGAAANGIAPKPSSPNNTIGGERTVKKLRLSKALTIPEGTLVSEACRRMAARRVDAVLLTDVNGLLSGIVTDKDISTRVIAEGLRTEQTVVSKIMTRNPLFVMSDSLAIEALQKMIQGKFRHLPVVETGEVIAMLDITKCLYDAISRMEKAAEQGSALAAAVEGVERQWGNNFTAPYAFIETLREKMFKPSLSTIITENTKVAVVSPSDPVYVATKKMRDFRVNSVIIGTGGEPQGILTSKDVLMRVVAQNLSPELTLVEKVMTANPECATLDTSILDALHIMHDGKFLHLPVLDREGQIAACLDVLQITNAAISMVDGGTGAVNDIANSMMQRFWDSALALEPPDEEFDSRSEVSGMMTSEYTDTVKSMYPPLLGNSFSFKFEDQKGRVHRFNCGTESLDELVSVVTQRIGFDDSKDKIQLLYVDDEGDRVLLSADSDLVSAVNNAKLAGGKEFMASPNETSPFSASPTHAAQSTEVSCKNDENEVHDTVKEDVDETVKSLTEKLSAALLSISAKEDLVEQHSKVAEEAVSGWEKAETEVTVLKQKLEATTQKNSGLEDKISQLDGALKECVRQLRQSRDEHEQKVQVAVSKKTQEWESQRSEVENQLTQLKTQLEMSKTTADNLQSKLEAIEKENMNLKTVLLKQSEELKVRTLEREFSTQTAESASKQHLESIKKIAKLEAEGRKLRALAQKKTPVNDQKTISSSACVESVTDSQSDVEPSCSDSWASALIAELDQFKNEKSGVKVLDTSVDIDLMDDFLEMERLAALPEIDNGSSSFGCEADSERVIVRENTSMVELEVVKEKMVELEEKLEKKESEKAKLEMALADTQIHLEDSCNQLTIAESKLVQLQNELDSMKESKEAAMSQLHIAQMEIENLLEKVGLLEGRVEEERVTSTEMLSKVEAMEAIKNSMESHFMSANLEVKKLKEMVKLLEQIIEEEKSLSTQFSAKLKVVKDEKKAVEFELVSAQSELQNLSEMVRFLERRVETEKALNAQFAVKCQNLEDELSTKSREVEVRLVSGLNGELSVNQGKDLVVAAEKLAECQKTIASLSNQLKSLTTLDDYIIDTER